MQLLRTIWNRLKRKSLFTDSAAYWEERYSSGGNSGDGSYNQLALFKAEMINQFIAEHDIRTVIDFGCGDGNQLSLLQLNQYVGVDVSPSALALCQAKFSSDSSKRFVLYQHAHEEYAELALSLDVLYHLIEQTIFEQYLQQLFTSAQRFVIIYASDKDGPFIAQAPHFRERKFTDFVKQSFPAFRLLSIIPNRHPYNGDGRNTSISDFYIYERITS